MPGDKILTKLFTRSIATLGILLLTSGCTKLGPEFSGVKEVTIPDNLKSQTTTNNKEIISWWKNFNDSTLNILVEKTYAQNLDLKSAGLRILQARAILGISKGLTYPQKQTLSGGAFSNRVDGNGFGTIGAGFDAGWEMDVWGKYARGIESSEATLFASMASYNNIMVSVIAEVARNYINYRTAQERMEYAKRNIIIQEHVTRITEVQFNTGNVSELDMQQSLAQLHTTRATLSSFKLSMVKAKNAMAVLMGMSSLELNQLLKTKKQKKQAKFLNNKKSYIQLHTAEDKDVEVGIIPTVTFDPSIKINANLITSRPDIKVAEYQARSKSANIGLSVADLYPSFTLLGSIGVSATNADGTWSSLGDSINASIGPAFSWNILQYDRIKNNIRLQDALFQESLLNYNKKVLLAISEVSDSIHGYTLTKEQQAQNEKAVDATVRAFNISIVQYNDGLTSYQRLFSTVDNLTRNQDRYAQVKGNLALNVIALYKSLGGGWQMSQGQPYIDQDLVDTMNERTDWGNYLDSNNTKLPKESN